MKKIVSMFLIAAFCLSSALIASAQTMPVGANPDIWARALKIHRNAIVVDGHNDIPSPMTDDDFELICTVLTTVLG